MAASRPTPFFSRITSRRYNALFACILIVALSLDTMLSNISDVTSSRLTSVWGLLAFVVIVATVFGSGQILLQRHIQQANMELGKKKPKRNIMQLTATLTQYVLMGILAFIIIQMVFSSQYYTVPVVVMTTIGYFLGGIIMGVLCYRFFSWYRSNRRNVSILLYGLAAALASVALAIGIIPQDFLLLEAYPYAVGLQSSVKFPTISSGEMGDLLGLLYLIATVSYLLVWTASALMLRHHSQRIGKLRYWLIISLALASFLIGLTPIMLSLPVTSTYFDPGLLLFRILAISALIANGILFGVVFLAIARSIRTQVSGSIIDYLNVAAYGAAILYISLAANFAHGSYPPFGIAAYSFIGAASYFFMSGIYSSAISVSTDIKIRSIIRRSALDESKLIDNISRASLEQEVEKRVMYIAKANLISITEETGVRPSLAEDDMKTYLGTVLKEINATKTDRKDQSDKK
jgi:hypothetical protein